jgi:hypothetical protein
LKTFNTVVYWRELVANLLDSKTSKKDPLKKFDKVPWLKRLVKAWKDNFAIEGGGKYSIVYVVGVEVVEFVTQSNSASRLAPHLDWKYLGAYVQLIAGNALLFGVCLIVPEQYMNTSGMVAVDVVIGECARCKRSERRTRRPGRGKPRERERRTGGGLRQAVFVFALLFRSRCCCARLLRSCC